MGSSSSSTWGWSSSASARARRGLLPAAELAHRLRRIDLVQAQSSQDGRGLAHRGVAGNFQALQGAVIGGLQVRALAVLRQLACQALDLGLQGFWIALSGVQRLIQGKLRVDHHALRQIAQAQR